MLYCMKFNVILYDLKFRSLSFCRFGSILHLTNSEVWSAGILQTEEKLHVAMEFESQGFPAKEPFPVSCGTDLLLQ